MQQLSKIGSQPPYNITLDDNNGENEKGLFKAIQEENENQVKEVYATHFRVHINGKEEFIPAVAYAAMIRCEKAFDTQLKKGLMHCDFMQIFSGVYKMDEKYSFKVLESLLNHKDAILAQGVICNIVLDLARNSISAYEVFKKIVADYYEEENRKISEVVTHIPIKPLTMIIREYLIIPFHNEVWKDFQVRCALSKHIKKT